MNNLAKIVSIIFHPLLMATYVLMLFYFYNPEIFNPLPYRSIPVVLIATFITTFLIPLLSIAILKMTSRVTSFELTSREERILPFISITLFYGAATYMFYYKLELSPSLINMMIVVTSLILILSVITLKFKISIHAAGNWGVAGLLIATNVVFPGSSLKIPIMMAILAAGIVSSARIKLNLHTPTEIWTGSVLGFLFTFSGILLLA